MSGPDPLAEYEALRDRLRQIISQHHATKTEEDAHDAIDALLGRVRKEEQYAREAALDLGLARAQVRACQKMCDERGSRILDLEEQVRALTRERDLYKTDLSELLPVMDAQGWAQDEMTIALKRAAAAEAELERLRSAVEKYGGHTEECVQQAYERATITGDVYGLCSCGWYAISQARSAEQPGGGT